ncbi:MAG: hypothetical protein LBF16_00940, partial [Pseudomonadales bacterium]|nr:hypothetical protein [Pseudomonadales bacterium]
MWDWLKEWFGRGSSDPSELADYDRMVANIGTAPSGIEEIIVTGHRLEPASADPPVNVSMMFEPGSSMVGSGWDNSGALGTGLAAIVEEGPASAATPAEEPDSAEDAPTGIEEITVIGHRPAPASADPSVNVHVMFELGSSTADSGWDNGGAGGTSSAQEPELVAAIEEEPVDSAEEEEKSVPAQASTKKPPAGIEEVTVTGHQVKPTPPIKSGPPINITLESGSSTIDLSGDSAGGGGTNSAHALKTVAIVEDALASAADPVAEEEEDSALAQTDAKEPPSGIEEIIVIGHRNEPPPMVTTDENGVVRVNFGWGSVESGATASKGSSAASALALLSKVNSGAAATSGGVEFTASMAFNSGALYSIRQNSSAI